MAKVQGASVSRFGDGKVVTFGALPVFALFSCAGDNPGTVRLKVDHARWCWLGAAENTEVLPAAWASGGGIPQVTDHWNNSMLTLGKSDAE